MSFVLTPAQMREADAAACERSGDDALMRAAGKRIAAFIISMHRTGRIIAFAGPGNNGGDAFAALAALPKRYERIVYSEPASHPSNARSKAERRARRAGVRMEPLPHGDVEALLAPGDLLLDGIYGTGSRLPIDPAYRDVIRALDARAHDVLAIDIPTGIDAATGAVDEIAVRATVTIALAALKPGLLLEPARELAGDIYVADIGIGDALLEQHARTFAALDDDAFLALLPRRSPVADKRAAGAPLVIAGSAQFPGAAVLCARAAARAGAGYVTVCAPPAVAATLRHHLIEQVVVEIPDDAGPAQAAALVLDVSTRNGSIALGPGLGLDDRTGAIVRAVMERSTLPMVVDASALFHLAKHLEMLRDKACVLTPHEGEFARLSGLGSIAAGTRVERLREFVDRTGIVTLLKGPDTLVYGGGRVHINTTGTAALATAGSGDVLTGMIATLLAQGLPPVDAARTAAHWHGLAGAVAQRERRIGVVAGDVIDALGAALPI